MGKTKGGNRLLRDGSVIEQGGVNFSHVYGNLPAATTQKHLELKDSYFNAEGISLVIHVKNPYVPSTHANFQFFITELEDCAPVWWFSGGYDLTLYYGFEEDCWLLLAPCSQTSL